MLFGTGRIAPARAPWLGVALCLPLAVTSACGSPPEARETAGISAGYTSDSDAAMSSGAATAAATNAGATSDSAGETGGTSGGATGNSASSNDATGDVSTTSGDASTSSSTTGDGTGAPPMDCWDSALNDWQIVELNEPGLGDSPTEPGLSSDGLSLYYSALLGGDLRRPYVAKRASLDDSFVNGSVIATWPGVEQGFDRPRPLSSHELALVTDGDLWLSVRTGDSWGEPARMEDLSIPWADPDGPSWWPENVVTQESTGSAVADGSRMLFTRQSGPTNPELDSPINRVLVGRRPAFAAPGTAYSMVEEAALPESLTGDYPYPLYCPTISPDGEHLFFASTYPFPVPVDPDDWIDKLVIQHVSRPSVDDPWSEEVTTLSSLSIPSWQACPAGVTPDGCQLVFTRNLMSDVLPDEEDRFRIFIATRS